MIEAVNSAVANASLLRSNVDQSQQDRLNSLSTAAVEGEGVELQLAPYISPFIDIDTNFQKAVLQIRDSSTGEVQRQFPSETTLRARAAQAEIEAQSIRQAAATDRSGQPVTSARGEGSGASQIDNASTESQVIVSAGNSSGSRTAEAQVASAAFAAGALSGAQSSGSVSVIA
ncbi:MAG: hypothetical protein CMH27_10600 [Micavibrio sp.]|nr:hypothetical protein [Micavibrio sp.]|tara:strand:- start:220 stop:738 length:519 start_codon:yes stop_codon:yes gene_type:complete